MNRNQVIALIGNTPLADTIEASLTAHNDLWVLRMSTADDLPKACRLFIPDFIIADLSTVALSSVVDYMTQYPGVSLLGIGPKPGRVLTMTCDQFTVQSATDLTRMIQQTLYHAPAEQAHAPVAPTGTPFPYQHSDTVPPHMVH